MIKSNQVYILDLTFGISFDSIVTKNYKNLIIFFYNNYKYVFKKILIKKKQFVPFLFLPVFLLGCLIRYMHKFFDIHLRVVLIYIYIYAESGGENYLVNACPRKFKGFRCS